MTYDKNILANNLELMDASKIKILLSNLLARRVGINQILNVYMLSLNVNVNELYN